MQEEAPKARSILEQEFLRRRARNPSYSLRAFSKLLGIPSGRVSQLLSEKRQFTPGLGQKIAKGLNYDPRQAHELLASIRSGKLLTLPEVPAPAAVDMDKFESIADPLHFSILSLLETDGSEGTASFVAQRLGVSVVEARQALRRLERVELVKIVSSNRYALSKKPGLSTSQDLKSAALRRAHAQNLASNKLSLDEVALELRDITSMTMAIDPAKLPEAKKRIQEFRRSLCGFLEGGAKKEVYRIDIQLVPLTGRGKK